ncbi:hypothetical protein D915_002931 [Fasciola hepatica]|uniref:Uncharacterized protein n=1 Tax=Fasciola hepatica TaxID=6192 RepID=A0A4E0RCB2_FASHE|nr:hypothetical protein D915_002931 [Fasciola hepatica]
MDSVMGQQSLASPKPGWNQARHSWLWWAVILNFIVFPSLCNNVAVTESVAPCPPSVTAVSCDASHAIMVLERRTYSRDGNQSCAEQLYESRVPVVCDSRIRLMTVEPCREGYQLASFIAYRRQECKCLPERMSLQRPCDCQSNANVSVLCGPELSQEKVNSEQQRLGDRCKLITIHASQEMCQQIRSESSIRAVTFANETAEPQDHLLHRQRRSVQGYGPQCGKNQHFVHNRNLCPETCENVLLGHPNPRCGHPMFRGPGCECQPGYVLDGILCVPPSQCGCLDSVCVDRAPEEQCRQWEREGRCVRDKLAMDRICRATCHKCAHRCRNQVPLAQCERFRRQGACKDKLYQMLCRLTCMPQECSCPSCKLETGACNPHTRNIEIRRICFRLKPDGQCEPLTTRHFKPCGECPPTLSRIPGKCDYCKGQRMVHLKTFFREEGGQFRCRLVDSMHSEKCSCKPIKLLKQTCSMDTTPIRTLYVQEQKSCFDCVARKKVMLSKPIDCRRRWIKRGPCQRRDNQSPAIRKLIHIKQVARNCQCRLAMRVTTEVCECPPPKRSPPVCEPKLNQMVVKETIFHPDKHHCVVKTLNKLIPKPPCPLPVELEKSKGKFVCNPETCERTLHLISWQWEHCKCVPFQVVQPAGRCCCPKPEKSLSICHNGIQMERKVIYDLVEGECRKHVNERKLHCSCPPPRHLYKCNSKTNEKWTKAVEYHLKPDGSCTEVDEVAQYRTECAAYGISRITECNIRRPGDVRRYRHLLTTSPRVEHCMCHEPESKIEFEACDCPEEKQPPVKRIQQCPQWCYHTTSNQCDTRCQNISVWQKLVYDGPGSGRCKPEIIRKIVHPCCCPSNRRILERSCTPSGHEQIVRIAETVLRQGRCVQVVRQVREKVSCPVGFIRHELVSSNNQAERRLHDVFGHLDQCKCQTRSMNKLCPAVCPEPIKTTECDAGSEELVHTLIHHIPVGCRCEKVAYKRRTSVLCPKFTKVISARCSPITNIETRKYLHSFQHGCECKRRLVVQQKPCGCPKPRLSGLHCDLNTNLLSGVKTVYTLDGSKCAVRKVLVQKRTDCRQHWLLEPRQNDGRPVIHLTCDQTTGQGRLWSYVWIPRGCKCVRRRQVVREGVCRCPPPQTAMHCDAESNNWVRKTTRFVLDKEHLQCHRRDNLHARPTYCPRARVRTTRCDRTKGYRELELHFYKRDHCHCTPQRRVIRQPCGCATGPDEAIKSRQRCDALRGVLHLEIITRRWNNEANRCMPIRAVKSVLIACKPKIRVIRESCVNGKMLETLIERYRDPNGCMCRERARRITRDCRCPTMIINDGACDGQRVSWEEVILERMWDPIKQTCSIERRTPSTHYCKCPAAQTQRTCKKGMIRQVHIQFRLNPKMATCERIVHHRDFRPHCEYPPELTSQTPHSSLFHRYRQSACDLASCTLKLEVFVRKYDSTQCACRWGLAEARRCTCCGCPKPRMDVKCQDDKDLVGTITYYATEVERCGHRCVAKIQNVFKQVDCNTYPRLPAAHWTTCDRTTCQQRFVMPYYERRQCRCVLAEKVLASRICCCQKRLQEEKRCHEGMLDTIIHRFEWKNGRCLRVSQKKSTPVTCPVQVETRFGECRPDTCRQPVFELGWRAEPRTCACRPYQTLRGEKECCCPEKPAVRTVCVGKCEVSVREVYRFDRENHRCIKENYVQRRCRKCPQSHVIREACDVSGTCLQTARHVQYIVENCHCKRLETVRQERCCCPPPVTLGSQCLEDVGVVETKQVSYDLVNGHCAKKINLNRVPTTCPPTGALLPQQTAPCNPQTCLRPVLGPRWMRIGCQCVQQKPQRFETCCCSNRIVRTKRICQPNGDFILLTQAWKFRDGECYKVMLSKGIQSPPCPPKKITPMGPCDPITKKQPVLLERFMVKQCNCYPVARRKVKRVCACPEPEETVEPCNPVTCLERVQRIPWVFEARNAQCRRLAPQLLTRPCCCRNQIRQTNEASRCVPETGQLEFVRTVYRFNPTRRICEPQQEKHIKTLDCPTHAKLLRGKCDRANVWTVDRLVYWKLHPSTCRCREVMRLLKRPCDCSLLDREPRKPICIVDEGLLLKKRIVHHERGGICQPEEKWLKKKTVCPDGVRRQVNCDPHTCHGTQITRWFERVGCRCVARVRESQGKCCCPKPHEEHQCLKEGKLAIVDKISYRLDSVRMECVKQVDRIKRDVECVETSPHVLRRYCDKEICHPVTLIRRVSRRNCQCGYLVRRVEHRDQQCCCPPPRYTTKCYELYGVLSRVAYKYELFRGQCVTRKIVDEDKIVCPPESVERHQPCDPRTGLRPVVRHLYARLGCSCVPQVKTDVEPCGCPAPRLFKEKCEPGMMSRKVIRVWFDLDGNPIDGKVQCRKRSVHLYNEPCQCPPPTVSKSCQRGEMVITQREQRMSMHTGHPSCEVQSRVKKIPVECDQNVIRRYHSRCWNHQRKIILVRQILDATTCECRRMVKIKPEACDCHLKNTERRACQNGVLMVHRTAYSSRPGLNRCVKTTSRSVHPVVCSGQPEVIQSSGCNIEQPNGMYQSEEVRWQQVIDCQCVTQRKQLLRLCGCPPPRVEKRCLDTVNLAEYKTTFSHVAGQCIPNRDVVTTEVRCIRPARIVEKSSCEHGLPLDQNPAGCMEQITVAFDQVEDCRCHLRTMTIRRPCCVPEPRTETHCDPVRSRWITKITSHKLVPGKVLFESGDLTIWDQVTKPILQTKEQVVTCPETQVREKCDPGTGMWTQIIVEHERVGCHCKRRRRVHHGRCKCPPARVIEKPCKDNFLERITEKFELIKGKCVARHSSQRIRCGCPKPIRRVYCDGTGRWVKCFSQFLFNPAAKGCRLVKHCVRWDQECPAPKNRLVGHCGPQTGFKQTVQRVRFSLDRKTCRCQPEVVNEWKDFCRCDHLNRVTERCQDGQKQARGIVHELINGECKPKQLKHTKPVVCPAPQIRILPCNRSPQSPMRGLRLKIVNMFELHGCRCVRRRRVYRNPCDCNLLHGEKRLRRCVGNGQIEMKHLFWTQRGTVCVPGMALYKINTLCKPEVRERMTPCQIEPNGLGKLRVERLERRIVGCQCAWVRVASTIRFCGCPKPRQLIACVDHGRRLLIRQTRFELHPDRCQPISREQTRDPCEKHRARLPGFKLGPCDPKRCLAERLDYRLRPVDCKCQLQRKRTLEPCCCPASTVQPIHCDPIRNVITQRQTTYELRRTDRGLQRAVAFCQALTQDRTVSVRCGPQQHRIRIGHCDGQFHLISVREMIVEKCLCKLNRVRHSRIRCGCPNKIQHVKGKCGPDQWAEDKWIGLRAVPIGGPRLMQSGGVKLNPVKCEPVLLESRRRRCACQGPVETSLCIDGKILVKQLVAYRLNPEMNSCERHVMRNPHPVRCPPARLSRSKCSARKNFVQHEIIRYWVIDQCQCRLIAKKRSWVCDCAARFPARQREFCHPRGHVKVIELERWINVGRNCKRVVERREQPIPCPLQLKMIRTPCDHELAHRRRVFWLQQRPRNCQCGWHRLSHAAAQSRGLRTSEVCRCRPDHQVRQCEPASLNKPAVERIIHVHYVIRKGECVPNQRVEVRPVVCGPPEQVINGPCDPITHTRLVKRVHNRLDGCECRTNVVERRCACSCPPIKHIAQCHLRDGLLRLIRVEHRLDPSGCLCEAKRRVRQKVIQCNGEKRLLNKGPCHTMDKFATHSRDRYRQLTWLILERDGCRCKRRQIITKEVCACDADPMEKKLCISARMLEMERSIRRLTPDLQCQRVVLGRTRLPVEPGKPERVVRCNQKTGLETVTEMIPYVENCVRRVRMRVHSRRCKCQSQPRLIKREACGPDCMQQLIWLSEVLTPQGRCKPKTRTERVLCCCRQHPITLPEHCDSAKGVVVSGVRSYRLLSGQCVPQDQLTEKPVVCPSGSKTRTIPQADGKIRVETRFHVREGCQCVPKLQITFREWSCPPPATTKHCIPSGPDQFSVQQLSVLWYPVAGIDGSCSRKDTVIRQHPVDCSGSQTIRANGCQLDNQRHALVRVDRVLTKSAEGCRCRPNPPKLIYHVCQCAKPEKRVKCHPARGLLMHISTQYELSGDRTRCIPHSTRRVWKVACPSSGHPERKGRTPCDPRTGVFFDLYEQYHRKGCRCEPRRWKVPGHCRCPGSIVKTRCLDSVTREVTTTSFKLTPKGVCIKSDTVHKELVRCPVPNGLLRPSQQYLVEQDLTSEVVRHVYPCGSAGQCVQKIREFRWHANSVCGCGWKTRLTKRSCCCPSSRVERLCNRRTGIVAYRKTEWHLHDGHCRQSTHVRTRPVACPHEAVVQPIEVCRNGKQKHVLLQPTRLRCVCVRHKKIIFKECLCPTVSTAEVVFMVDASVIKRQPDYLEHVQRVMHDVIHAFTLSNPSREQGNSYRFAILVYAHHPEMVTNLGSDHSPEQLLDRIDHITLMDTHGSNLVAALKMVEHEVIPNQRPNIPLLVYVITDGLGVSWAEAVNSARRLHHLHAQLTVIHVGYTVNPGDRHWLTQFVSQPTSTHLIDLPRAAAIKDYTGRLIQTMCTRTCPLDQIREAECGRQTGCLGRTYIHSYRFDVSSGRCFSRMEIRKRRCCCPQQPQLREICEGNRLYHYATNWQLNKQAVCTQFTLKRDITVALQNKCAPRRSIKTEPCDSDGNAIQWEIRRVIDGCKCKETRHRRLVRCHCDPGRQRIRCIADNLMVREWSAQQLINGECMPKRGVTKQKLICSKPFIFKSACDTMTCQRRVTFVEHKPQRCRCQRRAKVRYETCCCRGEKTVNYEGCKYEALKMFVERSTEPTVKAGACVQRTRYHFQPVACPKNPKIVRHQCRQAAELAKQGPHGLDPALIYRQVEHTWWQIGACECRIQRRAHFETCGCDQSSLGTDRSRRVLTRCLSPSGILITYVRYLRLEVAGRAPEHETSVRLLNLHEAKCQSQFKVQSVRKIVCPDAKTIIGPCVPDRDGRSYRLIHVHRWIRQGCQCKSATPELKQRVVCACRPPRGLKRCTAARPGTARDRLEFRVLRERLVSQSSVPGKETALVCVPMHPIEQTRIITCPKNHVRYGKCVDEKVQITVTLFAVHDCQCKRHIRHVVAKCQPSPARGVKHQGPKSAAHGNTPGQNPSYGLVMPVYRLVDCIDLLPGPQCRFMERAPYGICEKSGEGQNMLCRRTCNQCPRCSLDQITFRVVSRNGPGGACLLTNQRYGRTFLHRILRGPVSLAHCKLVCAKHPSCLSFDYYVTDRTDSLSPVCVLNRVDPVVLRTRWAGPISLGANPMELTRHAATRCFLFRKVCKKSCPKPQTEELSPCQCELLEQAVNDLDVDRPEGNPITHCVKRVKVLFYMQTSSGHCVRKQWLGTVPCPNPNRKTHIAPVGDCEDKEAPLLCQDRVAAQHGVCMDPTLRQRCPKSCGLCKCRGSHLLRGRCRRSGQAVETRISYRAHPLHHICTTVVEKKKVSCEFCPVGRYPVVHGCDEKSGRRRIAHVRAQLVPGPMLSSVPANMQSQRCAISVQNEMVQCGGCLASESDRKTVLPCRRMPLHQDDSEVMYQLKVITEYMVNDHGCCHVRRSERVFHCDGCPDLQIRTSQCAYGQRLRHFLFFTRPATNYHNQNAPCITHTITRRESCGPELPTAQDGCMDQLTQTDCLGLRKIGGCKPNSHYARQLCARTCGFCH